MENLDADLQRRVWQRVQNREKVEMPPLTRGNLRPGALVALENGAVYQNLSRRLPGREGEKLRKLWLDAENTVACVKGLGRLQGEPLKLPQLTPEKESAQRALMKCCHRERKLWNEWEQLTADGEYGPVYAQLARKARERCMVVLEVLGSLER